MLSAAKHLLYLLANKQKQILRFAQNDMPAGGHDIALYVVVTALEIQNISVALHRALDCAV